MKDEKPKVIRIASKLHHTLAIEAATRQVRIGLVAEKYLKAGMKRKGR
jgi:hypothetical protein